jgi:hypothetical protein
VIGWTADFFRFWWALAYWNVRKTWFRLNGSHRDSCPCQNFSDSGLALDSRCEAVAEWKEPQRFRKVCPLLVETKDGWRCSVDAERVRPFWTRAFAYSGGALLGLYLFGSAALYTTLRSTGYQLSYLTMALPWRWPELRHAQEQLHATRAQQAMAAGDFPAAILSLQTVCQLNPHNYAAAITLAGLLQISGQPFVAEHVYERLMQDIPEQRPATAQIWFHVLLARADYAHIKTLATAMLSEDSGHREAWLHALVFAARQTNDAGCLGDLLNGEHGLPDWCVEVVTIEQLVLQRHVDKALPRLNRRFPVTVANYLPYYQADRLLRLGLPEQASTLLDNYGSNRLPADEGCLLRLRAFRARGWTSLADSEYDNLLHYPMSPRLAALSCAFLMNRTTAALRPAYLDRFLAAGPSLTSETLPLYHASYLVAALGGDARAARILDQINGLTRSDAKPLQGLAGLLKGNPAPVQVNELLPIVPLPLEVIYAVQEQSLQGAPR